jgi:hypothetical protein
MTVTTDKQKPDTFMIDKQELKPGLVIFRRTDVKHRNWYCRIKIPKEDRYKTISLETPDINAAKTQAFYEDADVLVRVRHQIPVFEKTFTQVAQEYSKYHKGLAQSGEITWAAGRSSIPISAFISSSTWDTCRLLVSATTNGGRTPYGERPKGAT